MSARILVVEDEAPVRRGLVDLLRAQGHTVLYAETGPEALIKAREGAPDLILLDVNLPGLDGLAVLRELRADGLAVPVLMLTARGAELDKVTGFALGVDDWVVKPFSMLELLGRVGALLRRSGPAAGSLLRPGVHAAGGSLAAGPGRLAFGPVGVDLRRHEARRDGVALELPARAIDLLAALARADGAPVSRDALLDAVWGQDRAANPRSVDNMVVRLRAAIEADPANPVHLLTVHGKGYRLVTPSALD
jgi:DNA-binding response OmpR family regulator